MRRLLDGLSPDDTLLLQVSGLAALTCYIFLIVLQAVTQQLFARSIREAAAGVSPKDAHALEVHIKMSRFLCGYRSDYSRPSLYS